MKTHKRDYKTPANRLAQDIEPDFFEPEYHAQEARWKRKNRIKQFKHTISALTYENAVLKLTFIQKRAFLERLKTICREPNRSPIHRLADIDRELQIEIMSTKDYKRKEQS